MDKELFKADMIDQIKICEQTIQQNLGVIQYCKRKLEQVEKAELESKPKKKGADI